MGQRLLAPPNVKGWDSEQAWINASTWAARQEFASMLTDLVDTNPWGPVFDPTRYVSLELNSPPDMVDRLADVLLQENLSYEARRGLTEFLVATDEGPQPEAFADDEGFRAQKIREALTLIVGLPEFHVW
jgi:hypothetical protein